ncbi:hypothetical protein B0H14DRAFT_2575206 [Mycena olivaceomarginata]|nr:hypothetical protein B0H14DRAFT_2575206 [Mycena olivaceomarginata]
MYYSLHFDRFWTHVSRALARSESARGSMLRREAILKEGFENRRRKVGRTAEQSYRLYAYAFLCVFPVYSVKLVVSIPGGPLENSCKSLLEIQSNTVLKFFNESSSLKRRRLDTPADELDNFALTQGLVNTPGQNNSYPGPCRPNIRGSVRVKSERRKTAERAAAIKLRLVEAELNSARAKLETSIAERAAMRFVSGEDLEKALTCSICQDIMWEPVMCVNAHKELTLYLNELAELRDADTLSVGDASQLTFASSIAT